MYNRLFVRHFLIKIEASYFIVKKTNGLATDATRKANVFSMMK